MKKIFRKNQIIITALALMIAVAGYLQYTGTKIDDKSAIKEASSDLTEDTYEISDEDILMSADDIFTDTEDNDDMVATEENGTEENSTEEVSGDNVDMVIADGENSEDLENNGEENSSDTIENPGEAVLTSSLVENLNFAAEVRLNREQIRSKSKETLLEMINNTSISENQKQEAVEAMINLTDIAEREAAAEMLLEAKGFTDAVVSITDNSVDVVLDMGEITDAKRAQVEDIVKRKTNVLAENIVITPIQVTK